MRDADQLHVERAELEWSAVGIGFEELRGLTETVLVELRLDEPERQPRGDDGLHLDLTEQVREAADVILVPVGEDHRSHAPSAR